VETIISLLSWIWENPVTFWTTALSGFGGILFFKFWDKISPQKVEEKPTKTINTNQNTDGQSILVGRDVTGPITYYNHTQATEEKRPRIRIELIQDGFMTTPANPPGYTFGPPTRGIDTLFKWEYNVILTNRSSVDAYDIEFKAVSFLGNVKDSGNDILLSNSRKVIKLYYTEIIKCARNQLGKKREEYSKGFPEKMKKVELSVKYSDEKDNQYYTKLYFDGKEFVCKEA